MHEMLNLIFSEKNKGTIINLPSADFAKRMQMVKIFHQ